MNWSGALQDAFESALTELGPRATPNPIREVRELSIPYKLLLVYVRVSMQKAL